MAHSQNTLTALDRWAQNMKDDYKEAIPLAAFLASEIKSYDTDAKLSLLEAILEGVRMDDGQITKGWSAGLEFMTYNFNEQEAADYDTATDNNADPDVIEIVMIEFFQQVFGPNGIGLAIGDSACQRQPNEAGRRP
jgi:hypothetical protein